MKTYRYIVCRCSGEIEKMTIPAIFDPYEIAHKLPHSLVFTFVPKGHTIMASGASLESVHGPAYVLTTTENGGTHYRIPAVEIKDEHSAYHCYKNRF